MVSPRLADGYNRHTGCARFGAQQFVHDDRVIAQFVMHRKQQGDRSLAREAMI
jgi:hypothetical protein